MKSILLRSVNESSIKTRLIQARLISILVLITISLPSIAQDSLPVWISTGEYVTPTFTLETSNRFLLGTLECKLKEDGSMGDPFTDWGSILLSTDKNLHVQDSVYVKFIGDWYVMVYQALVLSNGQILLSGPAFHPDSNEKKLGLIWMDESLNTLQQSLIGIEGKKIDPSGTIVFNQAGNIVTYGKVLEKDESNPWSGHYYFMELSQNGEILLTHEQMLNMYAIKLWPVGTNKYHMWSWNNIIVQLNADFSFETTYSLGLPHDFLNSNIQPYSNQSYFILYDKITFIPFNDQPLIDIEVLHINQQANLLNTFLFGFEGENARGASLSSYNPDILFIGGSKYPRQNLQNESTNFNQIFIYKTDISGQILHASFYSTNSGISCGRLKATSDGGCLIPVIYYSNYPSQAVFYLKMDAGGNIVGLKEDLPFKADAYSMFPNPAKSQFTLRSASGLTTTATIFSMNGAIVKSFHFETSCQVDVSNLKPGVYVMQLKRADGHSESKKVIVAQ